MQATAVGLALAIGCCLYLGTGMMLGVPFQLVLSRWFEGTSFARRLVVVTALALAALIAALIAVVSALSVVVLSWVYPAVQSHDQGSDIKTEISWGQGS